MKKFAVGLADFYNNDMVLEVVEAETFREAIKMHPGFNKPDSAVKYEIWFDDMPETIGDIKQFFFDGDMLVGVVEIT